MLEPAAKNQTIQGGLPLYESRTFEFDPKDTRNEGEIKITILVRKEPNKTWIMVGPDKVRMPFDPGEYTLIFKSNSPQQLVSMKINPDPGGGRP